MMCYGNAYDRIFKRLCKLTRKEVDISCGVAAMAAELLGVVGFLREKACMFDMLMEVMGEHENMKIFTKLKIMRAIRDICRKLNVAKERGAHSVSVIEQLQEELVEQGIQLRADAEINSSFTEELVEEVDKRLDLTMREMLNYIAPKFSIQTSSSHGCQELKNMIISDMGARVTLDKARLKAMMSSALLTICDRKAVEDDLKFMKTFGKLVGGYFGI